MQFSSAVHPCDFICAKSFFSCASVQPHPCKNFFVLPFIRAILSVQNFSLAIHPCDLICVYRVVNLCLIRSHAARSAARTYILSNVFV